MRAVVDIGSVVMGIDAWTAGRDVEKLDIAGMDRATLRAFLQNGKTG